MTAIPLTVRPGGNRSAGVLTIYLGKPKIPVGKSNGSRHSVWEASEKMAVFSDDVIFLLSLVCSADLGIVCSGSSSQHVKFYNLCLRTVIFKEL